MKVSVEGIRARGLVFLALKSFVFIDLCPESIIPQPILQFQGGRKLSYMDTGLDYMRGTAQCV
jgi:hypothetical protein